MQSNYNKQIFFNNKIFAKIKFRCAIMAEKFFEGNFLMIKVKNLTWQIGEKKIFSDLNFEVLPGETIGIVGGEGSGKSSLLDIISGRLPPTSGEVKISGDIETVTGNISADFSELRLAEMSAIEKLKRRMHGMDKREIILLLDEPTKNLDADGIEWLINFLNTQKKLSTVIVSSDRYFLNSTCKNTIKLGNFDVEEINFGGAENFSEIEPDDWTLPKVLEVESLMKIRDGETLFKHINFIIRRGQKVAFVGQNKIGKSRLLKTLWKAFQEKNSNGGAIRGEIHFSDDVKLAYMPKVFSSAAAKLEIENLQKTGANFLLLDNPTICLDLPMILAIEKALKNFSGTIIFADEDRAFTQNIANRIMDIAPSGTVDRISTYENFLANATVQQQISEKYSVKE